MKKLCYPVTKKLITSKNSCNNDWSILEKIEGDYIENEIWGTCCDKDCNYILKYMPYENGNKEENIRKEIEIQNECSKINLSPEIADAWLCIKGGVIVMEKFDITIADLLKIYKSVITRQFILAEILSIVDKLHMNGIFHGDLHLNNIMIKNFNYNKKFSEEENYKNSKYKYCFVDFGKSGKFLDMSDKHIYMDYLQILDHLEEIKEENPKDRNLEDIIQTLKIYMKKFN